MNRSALFFLTGFAATLVLGWYVFPTLLYRDEMQPIQFSHKLHTADEVGLACEDCHEFSPDGRFAGIPHTQKCADCHSVQLGSTEDERRLVEEYVGVGKEIPWREYLHQPDNAHFPHVLHVKRVGLECAECHGPHGSTDRLRTVKVNRISGYTQDIWGENISGIPSHPWDGMKMDRCVRCHERHHKSDGCISCHK
jgi:hypothetical protein